MISKIEREYVITGLLDESSKLLALEFMLAGIRENDFEFAEGAQGLALIIKSIRESIEKIHSMLTEPELH